MTSSKKKVFLVSTSRAEFSLLRALYQELDGHPKFLPSFIISGTHLSSEFGYTLREVEAAGVRISRKIEILLSSDSAVGMSKTASLALSGFAEAFEDLKPDWVVLLGDRFEILPVAQAALHARIPVLHLHGGELSEGAIDDCLRHAITKLSTYHCVATEVARKRVLQLGEDQRKVAVVGAFGLDNVRALPQKTAADAKKILGLSSDSRYAIITYHAETLSDQSPETAIRELIRGLEEGSPKDLKWVFLFPNQDMGGRKIIEVLKNYCSTNSERCKLVDSLGSLNYLYAAQHSEFVIGNSSSGIIEIPLLKVPVINVGNRQGGRERSAGIIDCPTTAKDISQAIEKALSPAFKSLAKTAKSPYGEGRASQSTVVFMESCLEQLDSKKEFHDL